MVLTLFSACTPNRNPEPVFELRSAEVLYFDGYIAPETMGQLVKLIADNPSVSTLQIRSGGGDMEAAIWAARHIHARGLRLVVEDYCFSSCANYFVLAAREVHILDDSVIGFHGAALAADGIVGFGMNIMGGFDMEIAFLETVDKPAKIYETWNAAWRAQQDAAQGRAPINMLYLDRRLLGVADVTISPGSYFARTQTGLDGLSERIAAGKDKDLRMVLP